MSVRPHVPVPLALAGFPWSLIMATLGKSVEKIQNFVKIGQRRYTAWLRANFTLTCHKIMYLLMIEVLKHRAVSVQFRLSVCHCWIQPLCCCSAVCMHFTARIELSSQARHQQLCLFIGGPFTYQWPLSTGEGRGGWPALLVEVKNDTSSTNAAWCSETRVPVAVVHFCSPVKDPEDGMCRCLTVTIVQDRNDHVFRDWA
jgi:hypothetical protein